MVWTPGQSGNPKGGGRAKPWREALERALKRVNADEAPFLERIADKCVADALDGNLLAMKEIGDRLDGKPAQQQIHTGDDEGGAIRIQEVRRVIVDSTDPDSASV